MISSLLARRRGRLGWIAAAVFFAFLAAVPPLANLHELADPDNVSARFDIFLATAALVLALWSVSYNLMLGYAGMVSFAHAAYFGVGAYTVGLLFQHFHMPLLEGLLFAPLVAAAFGLVTGFVAMRAVRLYFSLLTLAISQLVYSITFSWYAVTGGDNGVHGLEIPDQLADYGTMYYFVAAVTVLCLGLMFAITRSPFGAALAAIRENRERAKAVGINVSLYELVVFVLAATFAGVAGGLFALYQQEAYPEMMYWTENAKPVVIALLGGTGSFLGPAIGAFIYTVIDNSLSKHFPYQFDVLLGVIVLGVVLVVPGGFSALPQAIVNLRNRFIEGEREKPIEEVESTGEALAHIDVARAVESHALQVEEPARGQVLLGIQDLSRSFGGLRAVREVSLEVRHGDRHAVIGPNGAGKSTLFNLITGRIKPDHGRVVFDGRDITGKPDYVIARSGIGRAFQITNIFPKLSVRQNLQYSMLANRGVTVRPFGIADRIYRGDALELLESVGLGRYADLPAGQLSHGDQRALELAISIALGSKLLLLDEPTAGMSPYETRKAMELVRRVATERGLTLLFCEHDMSVVFETARTVTVMHQGAVLAEGTPREIRENADVQRVYLGELEVTA